MVNSARTIETIKAVSRVPVPAASMLMPLSTFTPSTMPLSCSAMYGNTPTRQISVTTTASSCDLP